MPLFGFLKKRRNPTHDAEQPDEKAAAPARAATSPPPAAPQVPRRSSKRSKRRFSAHTEKMAKKFESHKEVTKILYRAMKRRGRWPKKDKVPDMRPPDGVQRKKRCQPCVATTGKRGRTEDDGEGSHSKRLRSSNA